MNVIKSYHIINDIQTFSCCCGLFCSNHPNIGLTIDDKSYNINYIDAYITLNGIAELI